MDLVTSVPRMSKEEFESILNSNMQVYIRFNLTLPSLPSLVKGKKNINKKNMYTRQPVRKCNTSVPPN